MEDLIDNSDSFEDIKWTPDKLCTQIDADVKGMKLYMRRAKKRRFVPSQIAPLEAYWCLFDLNYRISEASTGLGFCREKVPAIVFFTGS